MNSYLSRSLAFVGICLAVAWPCFVLIFLIRDFMMGPQFLRANGAGVIVRFVNWDVRVYAMDRIFVVTPALVMITVGALVLFIFSRGHYRRAFQRAAKNA